MHDIPEICLYNGVFPIEFHYFEEIPKLVLRLCQEGHEFKDSVGYIARLFSKKRVLKIYSSRKIFLWSNQKTFNKVSSESQYCSVVLLVLLSELHFLSDTCNKTYWNRFVITK
jgi:hypothetical protein